MEMVPLEKLVPYVNNARTHSPEQVNKLRSSLREFGFVNPVIVDKDQSPAWHPATLAQVSEADVARHFAPLGADELVLPEAVR